jgi:transcriptional regulator with PAS, ATPase and Fis domain
LIESELFGYEKGAFTDAKTSKPGLVEIANNSTLFLDEVGEMSLNMQPKLLRFIENGEFRRVGGINSLNSNVRVIVATNKNLMDEIDKKNFRRDLLFRLNVITLRVPPLRERKDDIPVLSKYFLLKKSPVRSPKTLSIEAENALMKYNFPGNIRELEHIIERAIIFSEDSIIQEDNLFIPSPRETHLHTDTKNDIHDHIEDDNLISMEEIEKTHIKKILDLNQWERVKTSIQLGISQKTLYTKIKKYNLAPPKNYL